MSVEETVEQRVVPADEIANDIGVAHDQLMRVLSLSGQWSVDVPMERSFHAHRF